MIERDPPLPQDLVKRHHSNPPSGLRQPQGGKKKHRPRHARLDGASDVLVQGGGHVGRKPRLDADLSGPQLLGLLSKFRGLSLWQCTSERVLFTAQPGSLKMSHHLRFLLRAFLKGGWMEFWLQLKSKLHPSAHLNHQTYPELPSTMKQSQDNSKIPQTWRNKAPKVKTAPPNSPKPILTNPKPKQN